VLVIGFLYRHAIELQLKSILAMTVRFRQLDDTAKRSEMLGHSVLRLWNAVEADLSAEAKRNDPTTMRRLIAELEDLDARSDGFRYPFTIPNGGTPTDIAHGLSYASADNLIWVLEAIYQWLFAAEDSLEEEIDFLAEMRDDAGEP
jgi:hypothetical protein